MCVPLPKVVIRAGCIYWVEDASISMPPAQKRTLHNQRTVLVVSGEAHNCDDDWPLVLVCPVSSGEHAASLHDVRVGAAVGGLRKKGFVRVALVQPIEKRSLRDWLSPDPVPAELLRSVHASIVKYMAPNLG